LIVADDTADARLIAFDLVSQAEHDEAAASVLVTHSETIANAVLNALEAVVEGTEHRQRVKVALSGQQSAVVLVDDLSAALRFANFDATEHLELHTKDPLADAARISNAGAIVLGSNSPVSLGDYIAGSNHVLPTGGQAKFGAGLGVHSFLRAQQLIDYTRSGLQEIAGLVRDFADAEGLPAHGDAIVARFE
jgi:histidinol dehydrogenase